MNRLREILCGLTLLSLSLCTSGCQPNEQKNNHNDKQNTGISMGKLLAADEALLQYHQVSKDNRIKFPKDHLPHEGYRIEWWYITANLTTAQGESIGIQWTQFRSALSPPDTQEPSRKSAWATNQMYMAHAALTTKTKHYSAEKYSRSHPEFAHVSDNPFSIYLENWRWQSLTVHPFPATLSVEAPEFGYQLELNSTAQFQLQGDQGFSVKSADDQVASHYYSQPYIEVSGTVTREGQTVSVSGNAWLDREWSSQLLTQSQQGWDWFSIRLNAQQTLMMFRLRGQQPQDSFYSARLMLADGTGRNINSSIHPDDIVMQPISWHTQNNRRYPTAWKIAINSENIDITTQALNPNSEMPLSTTYWEGPIEFSGSHSGKGYMELTGY
ncbi:lipocalin-like domain-containing protein [Shewanella subflava]|uniref:Carotenoid 1,2-hydratase n=1 Tax=Shewanella subflava TaxID=2986476 RepID=A0ABT3I753_9GAMM|nr:lipocalin-like domain-containing protein [Shewanella subflava]MCW3171887.1 carotenoid 1,2-hydratase [Shewanella subflava]